MKYLITEEQYKEINQSNVKMGPLGSSIRQLVDLIDIPLLDKFIVIYVEENKEYLILLWSKRGYINPDYRLKLTKLIEQYIPAEILIIAMENT